MCVVCEGCPGKKRGAVFADCCADNNLMPVGMHAAISPPAAARRASSPSWAPPQPPALSSTTLPGRDSRAFGSWRAPGAGVPKAVARASVADGGSRSAQLLRVSVGKKIRWADELGPALHSPQLLSPPTNVCHDLLLRRLCRPARGRAHGQGLQGATPSDPFRGVPGPAASLQADPLSLLMSVPSPSARPSSLSAQAASVVRVFAGTRRSAPKETSSPWCAVHMLPAHSRVPLAAWLGSSASA